MSSSQPDTLRQSSAYQYGVNAENLVCDLLKQRGFQILSQRYKTRYGEVDIVAVKQDLLVFVEVKARKRLIDGDTAVINQQQIRRNCNAGNYFLGLHPEYSHYNTRFDLAVIVQNRIESYIENAWEYCGDS